MRCRAKLRASVAQLAAPQSSAPERRICSQKAGTSVASGLLRKNIALRAELFQIYYFGYIVQILSSTGLPITAKNVVCT